MDRKIFRYHNGTDFVFCDPLLMRRRFTVLLEGDPAKALDDSNSSIAEVSFPAMERVRYAVCKAFELGDPFDPRTGEGVLEETWFPILEEFTEWLEKNVKADENLPTFSPPSDPSPPPETIPNMSASC